MYIKRYTIASLALMALIGSLVYMYITQASTSFEMFGVTTPVLPVAFLVTVPVFILYVASILHMSFYSLVSSLNLRKSEKDHEKIIDAIVDTYLGKKSRSYSFKTDKYKILGTLLENTMIFPIGDIIGKTNNSKIDAVLKEISDIKNGEAVDLKHYNLLPSNELVIQNERNRYKSGDVSADSILSSVSKYDETLRKEVYVDYVKVANISSIEKYKELLTKESLYEILARVNADEHTLEISSDELMSLLEKIELNSKDYIQLSSVISRGGMIPEQRIKLFELLSDKHEEAMDSYLYTLFDLEMLAPAYSMLDVAQPNEYQNFRAYRALKESHKNFSIELFVK